MAAFSLLLLGLAVAYLGSSLLTVAFIRWQSRRHARDGDLRLEPDRTFVAAGQRFRALLTMRAKGEASAGGTAKADIALVIDRSSSMHGSRLEHAVWGARSFVKACSMAETGVHIGLAVFNEQSAIIQDLSHRRPVLRKALAMVPGASGGTSIAEGLRAGAALLASSPRRGEADIRRAIILLTDGEDGDPGLDALAEDLRSQSIDIFCIGIEGADHTQLQRLAGPGAGHSPTTGNCSFFTSNPKDLVKLFEAVREVIESAAAKDGEASVMLHRDMIYLRTGSEHRVTAARPLTWALPWIKPEGEVIEMWLTPARCAGIHRINAEPASGQYVLEGRAGQEAETPKTARDSIQPRSVIVSPWEPAWFWGVVLHPLLAQPLTRLLCPKMDALYRPPAPMGEPPRPAEASLPAVDAVRQQSWEPTLVVALGGSGIATALRFLSFASDLEGRVSADSALRVVTIDSHDATTQPPAFGAAEFDPNAFIGIGADLRGDHSAIVADPTLHPWYETDVVAGLAPELFDTRGGTSRIRQLGRLSLHHTLQCDGERVRGRLKDAISWLAKCPVEGNAHPRVIVVTAADGGTGGAIFRDVVHMLLGQLAEQKIGDLPVFAVFPDAPPRDPAGFSIRSSIYQANRNAFFSELETAKAATQAGVYVADYPGAEPLGRRIFTTAEFVVRSPNGEGADTLADAACLCVALATGCPEFQHDLQSRVLVPVSKGTPSSPVVAVAISAMHQPATLLAEISRAATALELARIAFGVEPHHGRFDVAPLPCETRELTEAVQALFYDRNEWGLTGSALPALFPLLPGLASGSDTGKVVSLVAAALEICEPATAERLESDGEVAAATRTLAWLLAMLNIGAATMETGRLAFASAALSGAEQIIREASDAIRHVSLATVPAEDLAWFSESRLTVLERTLGGYAAAVQALRRHLSSWCGALGEGNPSLSHSSIGTARWLQRRFEVAVERIADYAGRMPAQALAELRTELATRITNPNEHQRLVDASRRIQWGSEPSVADTLVTVESLLRHNPLVAQVSLPSGDSLTVKVETCGQDLAAALLDLATAASPFTAVAAASPPPVVGWVSEANHFRGDIGCGGAYDCFARPVLRMDLDMSFGQSFTNSSFNTLSLRISSGDRTRQYPLRYVHRADAVAAFLRNRINEIAFGESRMHPLGVSLLVDLERTQRFIYLWCAGKITRESFPGTAKPVLTLKEDGASFYLSGPLSAEEHDDTAIRAALQYVVKQRCMHSDDQIPYDRTWRPAPQDVISLKAAIETDPLLRQISSLARAMHLAEGWIQP